MTSDRYGRAKEIFLKVRDLEPGVRTPELIRICKGDASIQQEVVSLLAYHDESNDFLEHSVLSELETRSDRTAGADIDCNETPVPCIGRYTVVRKLGAGGMGTVYEAIQDDPRRTVALKLLKHHLVNGVTTRRFKYEANILAYLRHPGIAHIFEAGTHRDGSVTIPYFAMEFIRDALPITQYAAGRQLDIPARLRLMTAVCDAVHYGHQHGIIHRDLKPANIVVDRDGHPKVIDFGVARATNTDQLSVSLITETGQLLGTPQYMSPEQFDGDPHRIDTRTDVYALGVVLYELLSGRLPYEVSSPALLSVAEAVKRQTPIRLSSVNRRLGGDLQTIVAKALDKSADHRYQSAADLSRDLSRFLDRRPIEARRPSAVYQLKLFARRRPGLLASIGFAVFALLLSTAISARFGWQARQAQRREAARAVEASNAHAAEAQARSIADARRADAEFQSYVANIVAADAELQAHGIAEARMRLSRTPPHLRNWEYSYLQGQLDRSTRTIRGHTDPVEGLAVSPDGRLLASVAGSYPGDDQSLCLWDFATGAMLARFDGYQYVGSDVAFGRDGKTLVSCGDDLVHVWNAHDLDRPIFQARLPTRMAQRVEIDTITNRVWCIGGDGFLRCWNYVEKKPLYELMLSDTSLASMRFDSNRNIIAIGAKDGYMTIVDAETGAIRRKLRPHDRSVCGLFIQADGMRMATASDDGSVHVWNANDFSEDWSIREQDGEVKAVAISPDGRLLASGGHDKTLRLYDLRNRSALGQFHGHENTITSIRFTPDGADVVTASSDQAIKIWNLESLLNDRPMEGHERLVRSVIFSPDGRTLASASFDGTLRLWNTSNRECVGVLEGMSRGFQDIAFSPDGRCIVTAARSGLVQTWDARTQQLLHTFTDHEYSVHAVAYHPDGEIIASGGIDRRIRLWKADSGELIGSLAGHDGWIWALAYSPDGRLLASASEAGSVILWDVATGTIAARFDYDEGAQSLAIDPAGVTLAVGLMHGTIVMIDLTKLTEVDRLTSHVHNVLDLSFNQDGSRLASSSNDSGITLWDVGRRESVLTLRGTKSNVWSVAFSPDGRRIASGEGPYGSWDCTVRVWESADSNGSVIASGL